MGSSATRFGLRHGVVGGLIVLATAGAVRGDVWYVRADAEFGGDGTSWATATSRLQLALAASEPGDEIWVAVGVHRPTGRPDPNDPRTATFWLRAGVGVYGGFRGPEPAAGFAGETTRDQRDPGANETILSGDLNRDDAPVADPADLLTEPTRADNAYHVVTANAADPATILDGFTITAGQATGTFPHNGGGGLLNDGGNPTVQACRFESNAAEFGGGMLNNGTDPRVSDCAFDDNGGVVGGGMYNQAANPVIT